MKGIRTFVGIFPPPEIQSALFAIQSRFKIEGSGVNWEEPKKFHVTFKFLGDIFGEDVSRLDSSLRNMAKVLTSFEVRLARCGVFPTAHSPKVVWVGSRPADNGSLVNAFGAVESACVSAGFKKDEREFHPHITIGRVKRKMPENLIQKVENTTFEPLIFPCTELLIMKSVLSPSGSTYSQQSIIPLLP